jgi:hypothetical protein
MDVGIACRFFGSPRLLCVWRHFSGANALDVQDGEIACGIWEGEGGIVENTTKVTQER